METAGFGRFSRGRIAIGALAVAAALVPVPPRVVDRLYSAGLYTRLQPAVTTASNLAPVALLDLLLAGALVCWIALAWRDARSASPGRAAASIAIRTATVQDGVARYGTGGAVTLLSDPEEEADETLAKAAPFLRAANARLAGW